MAIRIIRRLLDLLDVNADDIEDGETLTWDEATGKFVPGAGGGPGGGGAPTDATYLVTTANDDLDAEVVVGATPGGELGGTWASPTVDATHSGSSHASVQAAAEATAAAALLAHTTDSSDAHDASAISSVAAGNLSATDVQAALNELDTEKAAASHVHAGEDITSGTVADARIASTIARDSEVTSAISTSESGQVRDGDAAGGVLGGTYPNPSFAADMATQAELDAHVSDSSAAHAASAISADSTTLVGTGTDVQAVLEELDNGIADHLADSSDAHDASAISFSPTGSIAATDVQTAIAEVASEASGIPTDGWIAAGETWTYASADDPTFTFTISGDLTTKYSAGMRLKLTQTTEKYFIVTKVEHAAGTTTMTVYGGTDYDLANAAISSPYWSPVKAPFGFPLAADKWTLSFTDSSLRTQATPVAGTWYNLNSNALAVHIGSWILSYKCVVQADDTGTGFGVNATLSTANNTESDPDFSSFTYATATTIVGSATASKPVTVTSKTSYFLNVKTDDTNQDNIRISGAKGRTVIRAVCAYL